jgi:hypothetical protein
LAASPPSISAHLLELGLEVLELGAPAVLRAARLAEQYRRPSRIDLTALALAEQEHGILVTGDRHLRLAAEAERVEVRGTLWLARRLVEERVITVAALRDAYGRMRETGRRLPWTEVERQLEELEAPDEG